MPPRRVVASCLSSFQLQQAIPQIHQSPLRLTDFSDSVSGDSKILLCPATTFRRWLAQFRRYEALFLKTFQRGIHASNCDFPPGLLFDLSADGHAVGIVTQAHQCQDHHEFPFAKMTSAAHFFNYTEEI